MIAEEPTPAIEVEDRDLTFRRERINDKKPVSEIRSILYNLY